ncbi:hypothetical protein D3C80_1946050 [compost metagenome]
MEGVRPAQQFGNWLVDDLTQPRTYEPVVKRAVDFRGALHQREFAIVITGRLDVIMDIGDSP